jgi:hypothetical protein
VTVMRATRPATSPAVAFRSRGLRQAQVLVVYREVGALGVVSGACRNPRDLNATAGLVAGLVARMTVTAVAPTVAAAVPAWPTT